MFGHRNYSRYSFNAAPPGEPFTLGDSMKVNKLKGSQLSVYFHALKHNPTAKEELLKRNNHFEEFKKALSTKRVERMLKNKIVGSDDKNDTIGQILKRYGVRHIKERESRPAIRRAPLRSIKTVGIEVPSAYKPEAIYIAPKKKDVDVFVEITKPLKKEKPRVQIQDTLEIKEFVESPSSLIEEQLQDTKQEIDLASTQLEQIKNLLNTRKSILSPVREEEEIEAKINLVRELVDKKCSPIQPRTQFTVKSVDADKVGKAKKNKLMSTLNNLNQRLLHIQDKYFNEPKVKYKSISDFVPPRSKATIETLYRNIDYGTNTESGTKQPKSDEESEPFEQDPNKYMQELVRRTKKVTKLTKKDKPTRTKKTDQSVLVLMSPKCEKPTKSEQRISSEATNPTTKRSKGILKAKTASREDCDTVLEAPLLQESICKSNYLMKEFNLGSNDKNFDLSKLSLNKYDEFSSTDYLKKNVRFSKSAKKHVSNKDSRLQSNIDVALKNSLFYHDDQDLVQ